MLSSEIFFLKHPGFQSTLIKEEEHWWIFEYYAINRITNKNKGKTVLSVISLSFLLYFFLFDWYSTFKLTYLVFISNSVLWFNILKFINTPSLMRVDQRAGHWKGIIAPVLTLNFNISPILYTLFRFYTV